MPRQNPCEYCKRRAVGGGSLSFPTERQKTCGRLRVIFMPKRACSWRLLAILMMIGMSAGGLRAAENLIKNDSLEDANQDYPAAPLGFGNHIRQGTNNVDRHYQWADAGRSFQKAFKSELSGEYAMLRPSLKVESLESNTLYRYSLWYRTESDQPVADVIDLQAAGREFPYPTSPDWVQAHIFFLGKEFRQLEAVVMGYANGSPNYKMGSDGKPLKDAQGQMTLLNPARVTAWIDDLELRPVTAADYQGNLLENGDFETGRPPHKPAGWRNMYTRDKRAGALDNRVFHSGKQSLRLDCTNVTALAANGLPVHPDDICTFSFWIKSTLASLPLRVDIYSNGKKNNSPYNWFAQKHFTAGTAWRQIQFMVEIPGKDSADYDPDTAIVQPQIRIELPENITGTVWLDDAEFIIEHF